MRNQLASLALGLAAVTPLRAGITPVRVQVDMNAEQPGFQTTRYVPAGDITVEGLAVYIYDPLGTRSLRGIGYIGAIDRGISFGHSPSNEHQGDVTAMRATPGAAVNPGNTGWLLSGNGMQKAFSGPEVQYLEFGSGQAALIPANPQAPVLRASVDLVFTRAGDVLEFFVLDMVSVWRGGTGEFGAFSTVSGLSLDTGGDVVPDQTYSVFYGTDPDTPVPAPPGAYPVDYIDGPNSGGGATIRVVARGDTNCDGALDFFDIDPFVLALFDLTGYRALHCGGSTQIVDTDCSGAVDFFDTDSFLACLIGTCTACP